ncbi:adenylate kinase family protein [Natrarchaeobaculum sulfurireducens]|uniref:Putative adenylate kinase n=1 Tax=Natrarchaeobaculum sulfurireducens TaxID=2044521 RepID=A0A346PE29_9EURY|nr:adenylate kinase family protein [Natrarchaeobaculum sulfurireducens]AXR77774.1 Broad-specificity NMP kinase [Natrarchaeobaculum sulfurireducens]AXR82243.1 AMP/CMP kinase AK6 [Natrarchaeobaculum sulfurireducens]
MRVAVTGTPGTGKTTATELLESRLADKDADSEPALEVIHLNEVLEEEGLYTEVDADRESKVADLEALADWLEGRDDAVIESHLAHHFDVDRVAVLRCRPTDLEERLLERGEREAKARENAESEALDVLLAEAVETHGLESVYEIDTTDRDPEAVADALGAVVAGEREPTAGDVDFVGYLE